MSIYYCHMHLVICTSWQTASRLSVFAYNLIRGHKKIGVTPIFLPNQIILDTSVVRYYIVAQSDNVNL